VVIKDAGKHKIQALVEDNKGKFPLGAIHWMLLLWDC
jgi:hypothetical protein